MAQPRNIIYNTIAIIVLFMINASFRQRISGYASFKYPLGTIIYRNFALPDSTRTRTKAFVDLAVTVIIEAVALLL